MPGKSWVPNYVVAQGVHNGWVVLCLRCKGITYFPNNVYLTDRIAAWEAGHDLWCPVVIEMALALLQ